MVHYFGDSFTEGCGIVKQTKPLSASKIDLISSDISENLLENSLTKLFKEQHYKNYAVGGVCNEDIVNSIYSNINNFNAHDFIVIGTTCAGRKKFYFEDLQSLIDINEKVSEYVLELQMLPTHYDEVDNYLKKEPELSYYNRFDKNTLKAVNSYYKQYLMQDKVIEYEYNIAPGDTKFDRTDTILEKYVPVRYQQDFNICKREDVDFIAISPIQVAGHHNPPIQIATQRNPPILVATQLNPTIPVEKIHLKKFLDEKKFFPKFRNFQKNNPKALLKTDPKKITKI